jgi:hypothetical protein
MEKEVTKLEHARYYWHRHIMLTVGKRVETHVNCKRRRTLTDCVSNNTRAFWKVRGLATVRRCYAEGGEDCYAKL